MKGLFEELREAQEAAAKQAAEREASFSAELLKQKESQERTAQQLEDLRRERLAADAAVTASLGMAAAKTDQVLTEVVGLQEGKANAEQLEALGREGATAVQIAMRNGGEVSKQVGAFSKHFPVWLPDNGLEEQYSIKYYPETGMAYCCIAQIQRFSHYTPDEATNNYCPYPEPDKDGIYPYVYGMLVWPGMDVRSSDGKVYHCILPDGTYKLVYDPKDVASIFNLKEV